MVAAPDTGVMLDTLGRLSRWMRVNSALCRGVFAAVSPFRKEPVPCSIREGLRGICGWHGRLLVRRNCIVNIKRDKSASKSAICAQLLPRNFFREKVQNKWPSRQTPEPFMRKPVPIAETLELTAYRLSLVVLFDTKLVANVHWSWLTPL